MAFDSPSDSTDSDVWNLPYGSLPFPEFTDRDIATIANVAMWMRLGSALIYFGVAFAAAAALFTVFSAQVDRFDVLVVVIVACMVMAPLVLLATRVGQAATAFQQSLAGWSTLATGFRALRKCLIIIGILSLLHAISTLVGALGSIP